MITTTVLLGFMTHHYISPELDYCNAINDYGTIQNTYAVVLREGKEMGAGVIAGKDSSCGDIAGPVFTLRVSKNVRAVVGGYNTNVESFNKRKMIPPEIRGITPVVGIDYSIPLTKKVSLDTIVALGVITHAISYKF